MLKKTLLYGLFLSLHVGGFCSEDFDVEDSENLNTEYWKYKPSICIYRSNSITLAYNCNRNTMTQSDIHKILKNIVVFGSINVENINVQNYYELLNNALQSHLSETGFRDNEYEVYNSNTIDILTFVSCARKFIFCNLKEHLNQFLPEEDVNQFISDINRALCKWQIALYQENPNTELAKFVHKAYIEFNSWTAGLNI